jgi:hypothetical protein
MPLLTYDLYRPPLLHLRGCCLQVQPQPFAAPAPALEPAGPAGGSALLPLAGVTPAAPAGISQDGTGDSGTFFSADSLPFSSRERPSSNNWTGSASFGPRTTEGGAPPVPATLTPATAAALARVGSAPPSMYVSRLPAGGRLPGFGPPWPPTAPLAAAAGSTGTTWYQPPQRVLPAQTVAGGPSSGIQAGRTASDGVALVRCPYVSRLDSHGHRVRADEVSQTHRSTVASAARADWANVNDGINSDDDEDGESAPQAQPQHRGGRLARFFNAAANTIRSALGMSSSGPQAQRGSTSSGSSIPTISDSSSSSSGNGGSRGAGQHHSSSRSQQTTSTAGPAAASTRPATVTVRQSPFAAGAQTPVAGNTPGGAAGSSPAAQHPGAGAAAHIPNYRSPSSTTDAASLMQLLSRRVVGTRVASTGALHAAGGTDSGSGAVLRRRVSVGPATASAAGASSLSTTTSTGTGLLDVPPRAPGAPYRSALPSPDATEQSLDTALVNAIANMLRALETRLGGAERASSSEGGAAAGVGPGSGPAIQLTGLPLLSTRRWTSNSAPVSVWCMVCIDAGARLTSELFSSRSP